MVEKLHLEILEAKKLGTLQPVGPKDGGLGLEEKQHTRSLAGVLAATAGKLGAHAALTWLKHKVEAQLAEHLSVTSATASASLNGDNPIDPINGITAKWLRITRESSGDPPVVSFDFLAELRADQRDALQIVPRRIYWATRAAAKGETVGLSIQLRADAIWLERNVGRQATVFDVCVGTARARVENAPVVSLEKFNDEDAGGAGFYYPKRAAVLVPRPPWSIDGDGKVMPRSGRVVMTATVTEASAGGLKPLLELLQSAIAGGSDPVADGVAEALKAAFEGDEKKA